MIKMIPVRRDQWR